MEIKEKTKNRGIWCGIIKEEPVFDHSIVDKETGETIKEYYIFQIEVKYTNEKGTIKDTSTLPVLVSKNKLERLGKELKKDTILFVKGEWRSFVQKKEDGKTKTDSKIQAFHIETLDKMMRTQNKIEFVGKLARKLYKVKFNEAGEMVINEKGKPEPVLDENGEKIPWVRRNKEGYTVNDFHLEVKGLKRDRTGDVIGIKYVDFTPCIAYGAVAWKIAKEIEKDTLVHATGYIRRRLKDKKEGSYVYEAVITAIEPI